MNRSRKMFLKSVVAMGADTSGHVRLEFNTNPQDALGIPRPLQFESHIKHLALDFYRFPSE
jgi:hypothetical protein